MKLVSTTLFLVLVAASSAFSVRGQSDTTAGAETNYKKVNGFSGYLTLDDYPRDRIQRWLDPRDIVTLSAMPTMKRGKTMGAFVELMGCKQNAQGACNARVNYTIFKPDGSIFATRTAWQRGFLWRKETPPSPRRGYPKRSGLARMLFRFTKLDPVGEYKVKVKVTDLNADISLEPELNFYLK